MEKKEEPLNDKTNLFYILSIIIDGEGGEIKYPDEILGKKNIWVKRIFFDEKQDVVVELQNGNTSYATNQDADTLQKLLGMWMHFNKEKYREYLKEFSELVL